MCLADLFVSTLILDGGPALDKAEVVGRLVTLLARAGHVPLSEVSAILAAVLRREHLGSTGIGRGLAVPHAKHAAVQRPLGVLAVCRPPVWFDAVDGEPVDIVALLLVPPERPGQHLGEASRGSEGLTRQLADADFCRRLRQACSAEEIEDLVQAAGGGMTRREWLACTDPAAMLRLLRDRRLVTERKALLVGAACCRRLWGLLPDQGRGAVEVVERHADGLAGRDERAAARGAFPAVAGEASGPVSFARVAVSYLLAETWHDLSRYAADILSWAARAVANRAEEQAGQAGIIRCIFGSPPFKSASFRPEWLAFGDGIVLKLARCISNEGATDRLPILADALEEAGATDAELLGHLRGPGPHARGCWAVDISLGRE